MAKDKFYDGYMAGKISACNIVKESGIDALEKDIKLRNMYHIPYHWTETQLQEFITTIGEGSRQTVFAILYCVLHEEFGFGEKRLKQFYDEFGKRFSDIFSLTPFGNNYVSLLDFGMMMKEKYPDLPLDLERIAIEENGYQKNHSKREHKWIDNIIRLLQQNGYTDASDFLIDKRDSELEQH